MQDVGIAASEPASEAEPPNAVSPQTAGLIPIVGSRSFVALPGIAIPRTPLDEGCSLSTSPAPGGASFATPRRKKPQKYKNSVGGHHLLLSLGDGKILKECARREEKFYIAFERAMSNKDVKATPPPFGAEGASVSVGVSLGSNPDAPVATPPSLQPKALAGPGLDDMLVELSAFVPRFYGSEVVPEEDLDLFAESTVNDYSYDRKLRMLRIQDVTYGYEKPCVLDLKMGSRQYGLNAPDRKVESKTRKSRESTSEKLGCRMSGWQKWVATENRMVKVDKYQCRSYNDQEFTNALRSFLNYDPALMGRFKQLVDALKTVFEAQNVIRLYTSSLLFVYDAVRPVETARLFMVDFAYCYTTEEVMAAHDIAAFAPRDEGYYLGLQTLSRVLSPSYPSSTTAPIPVRGKSGLRSQPSSLGKSPPHPLAVAVEAALQECGSDLSDDDASASAV